MQALEKTDICLSLRIETTGPELLRRGRHYAIGNASCSGGGTNRTAEKCYSTWALGTVDSGVFRYGVQAGPVLAVPGTILFGNPGEAFTCQHLVPEGNRRSVIAVDSPLMTEVAEALGLDDIAFKVSSVAPGPRTAALYGAVRRLTRSERVLESELIEVIAAALMLGRKPGTWKLRGRQVAGVLNVVKHLETRYAESHHPGDLAAIARLSRFHFIRLFRTVTGVSPHQFLIGLRLRAACELLQTTSQPITSLALEVGFNDISHFNRTFRRAFGMSPRAWREYR